MAGYNPFSVGNIEYKRKIILRPPPPNEELPEDQQIPDEIRARLRKEAYIWIKEMPENQRRRRGNTVIDQATTRGGRGGTRIRLDRQRRFDWDQSLVRWDFTANGLPPEDPDAIRLELNEENISNLPGSISEQIQTHIDELNEEPTDDTEYTENEYGERVKKVVEHPTSANSELNAVSG